MDRRRVIFYEPITVADQLATMGLNPQVLRAAVEAATRARAECTSYDPLGFIGISAWARAVRTLRESLKEHGWRGAREGNLELVINPAGDLAIDVSTGDAGAGNRSATYVRTKYPKGVATEAMVEVNAGQLEFAFAQLYGQTASHRAPATYVTWMLLINWTQDQILSELSLPLECDDDGYVVGWAIRIVLEPIAVEPDPGRLLNDQGEVIDVPIARRR